MIFSIFSVQFAHLKRIYTFRRVLLDLLKLCFQRESETNPKSYAPFKANGIIIIIITTKIKQGIKLFESDSYVGENHTFILGSVSLIIRVEYGIQCMSCSPRIISDITPYIFYHSNYGITSCFAYSLGKMTSP